MTAALPTDRKTFMDNFIIVLIVFAALLTAATLVRGIVTMARGKDIDGLQANKLMSYRVAFQLVTIILVVILVFVMRSNGG